MSTSRDTFQIGPYEAHILDTGTFALDGGAMFGVVPKSIWKQLLEPDSENRIDLASRSVLLRRDAQTILIDCGMGTVWAEKQRGIYKIQPGDWALEAELRRLGLSREDITDVVATHLHFDHMGGIATMDGSQIVPSFPKARVWVQEKNWRLALSPNEKERASYRRELYEWLEGDSRLRLIDSSDERPEEILPFVYAHRGRGHSEGMQVLEVADAKTSLIFPADLIPTIAHVRLPFLMAYDSRPLELLSEKRALLEHGLERNSVFVFQHCSLQPQGRLRRTERGIEAIRD